MPHMNMIDEIGNESQGEHGMWDVRTDGRTDGVKTSSVVWGIIIRFKMKPMNYLICYMKLRVSETVLSFDPVVTS